MLATILSWVAAIILLFTSTGMLLSQNWRFSLGLLALQYLAVFWLVTLHWPLGMATVKLVTGWMTAVILGLTHLNIPEQTEPPDTSLPQGRIFQFLAATMIIVLLFVLAPQIQALIPGIRLPVAVSSLLLVGLGLLHLGLTSQILRITLALLSILSGFEILYAAVESSILLAGLLAITNLGLALAGAYLLIHTFSPMDGNEEA
ncbi:MAG: hypothetical protein ACP5QU_01055 [Anaerolineae bacterium]